MSVEALVCQMLYKQRADAAGVLALVIAVSSSGVINRTAKCKIKPHKKYRNTIIHTRITHRKTTLS